MRFWILPVITFLLATAYGPAQDYTWSGAGGNGSWANPANWDTLPVSGNSSRIILNGTTQTVTTQDFVLPIPFALNRLQMNSGASAGFIVNGNAIQIAGASAALQSASTGGSLVVNTAIDFTVSTALNLNDNFIAGPELILNGRLSSSAGPVTLTVSGGIGTGLVLGGVNNAFSGTLAFLSGAQAIVSLGAANTLTRTTTVDLTGAAVTSFVRAATTTATGSGFANAGFNQQLGSIQGVVDTNGGITSGFFQVGATGGVTSTVLSGFDNTNTSLTANSSAGIQASINIFGANSHFGKVGTGTFTYGGSGALGNAADGAGSVSVRDGTFLLQSPNAANGALQNGANAQADLTVYAGATLRLGNGPTNNQNRIGNTAVTVLNGGTLQMDGNAAGATSERIAGLSLQSGQSTIAIGANGHGTRFTLVNTIATSPTAAVVFQAANLGETISTSTGASANGFNFDTPANATALLVGGVTTGVYSGTATNLGIVGFASTGAANPDSFVTYDAANQSLRRLADANYAAGFGTATDNVSVNALTPVTTDTANSLRLTAGGSVTILTSLTLTSGSLLNNGGGSVTGPGPVNFGPGGTATAYVTTNGAMSLTAPIAAANVSKNGAGNLTVDSINLSAATGPRTIAVNAGTLTLAGPVVPGALSSANTLTYQVSRGATLAAASGLSLGANQILQGGGTQTTGAGATATLLGALTVANGGTVRPSTMGGSGPALASPGVLNVTGNVVFQPGGTFEWCLNSVHGAHTAGGTTTHYTQSLLNATGTLDLTALSTANKFNVKVTTLTLSNSPGAVTDFDGGTYTATIATFTGGINGTFDPNSFNLIYTPTDFGPNGAILSLGASGSDLIINFTPVPEPSMGFLVLVTSVAGFNRLRSRRRAA